MGCSGSKIEVHFRDVFKAVQDRMEGQDVLIVDVREVRELLTKPATIQTAVNIPRSKVADALGPQTSPEAFSKLFGIPKPGLETRLIFFCGRGPRGSICQRAAEYLGYRQTFAYAEGFEDWLERSRTDKNVAKLIVDCVPGEMNLQAAPEREVNTTSTAAQTATVAPATAAE